MQRGREGRRLAKPVAGGGALAAVRLCASCALPPLFALALFAAPAQAAGPPKVDASWATDVTATSASLHATVNPEGLESTYRFEYLTEAEYQTNPPGERFTGATKAPSFNEENLGSEESDQPASQHIAGLQPATAYRYRIYATNSAEPQGVPGEPLAFTTEEVGTFFELPDNRAWELVSPVDKNGGAVQGFGANSGGDVLQAAENGNSIAYSSSASFGESPEGAPTASQYIARRVGGEEGWSSQNITTSTVSGSYGNAKRGVPYQLFSPDLSRGLLLNGQHCRGEGTECPVANPPLPGTGAPAGYQNYYLRNDESGGFQALLTATPALSADKFNLDFAGASPDLSHVVLSTCAKLTPEATEQPDCESGGPNLYEWSGGGLRLINRLGSDPLGTSDAHLAASSGAISSDGSRVYFTEGEDALLYLREGEAGAKPVSLVPGAQFQTATPDGSFAFYTKGEELFRYSASTETSEPLATGVQGVLGASAGGSRVYYLTSAGLFLWHAPGTTTQIGPGAPAAAFAGDYPPATGTSRTSADGTHLAFLSTAKLTGYDNTDQSTGKPDSEVYLYTAPSGGGEGTLACISCNPTGERPEGPSTIPGAIANGEAQGSTDLYKPRNLSTNGARLFFDSQDALVPTDASAAPDVYEWEAQNEGTCQRAGGCLSLISSGQSTEASSFVDASANGSNAFFLTGDSLVPRDPGSVDLYDAREGGGVPEPTKPTECDGDSCQEVPSPPEDPAPGTLVPGSPNPPVSFPTEHHTKPKGKHHHKRKHHRASRHRGGHR